jgi:hypothetical protein
LVAPEGDHATARMAAAVKEATGKNYSKRKISAVRASVERRVTM